MATEYSITYTYTGQSNKTAQSTPMVVARDKFTVSGDTDKHIGRITRIVYKHPHTSLDAPTWTTHGRLHFADGSYIDSEEQSQTFNSTLLYYEQDFLALPAVNRFDTWTQIETVLVEPLTEQFYWRANAETPITLTVYFEDFPPVYERKNGAWVEMNVDGIKGKSGGAWKDVESITKI